MKCCKCDSYKTFVYKRRVIKPILTKVTQVTDENRNGCFSILNSDHDHVY